MFPRRVLTASLLVTTAVAAVMLFNAPNRSAADTNWCPPDPLHDQDNHAVFRQIDMEDYKVIVATDEMEISMPYLNVCDPTVPISKR